MERIIRVYVDSNALINYFTKQRNEVDSLNYLFRKRTKDKLFTSSLAISQTVSNLQTKKKTRSKYSRKEIDSIVNFIFAKFTILDCTKTDITNAQKEDNSEDFEDCIHFVISQKVNCNCIVTNNLKDFSKFDIPVVKPVISNMKTQIQ